MKGKNLSRREFISKTSFILGGTSALLASSGIVEKLFGWTNYKIQSDYLNVLIKNAVMAKYWINANSKNVDCLSCHSEKDFRKTDQYVHQEKLVKCLLCAQGCIIEENERGRCRTRINLDGKLKSLVYGRPISIHIDPIEKKPFYHFLPGSDAYSLATSGCPLSCQFCQNWEISQSKPEDFRVNYFPPDKVTADAENKGVPIIAFTYNEPTVFLEYMIDIANEAKKKNIRSVLISCGFMNPDPLKELCETLDAIKIDLKGYSEEFYKKVCSAQLKPVLRTIKQIARSNTHLEIVNLVVPTLNDSDKMMNEMMKWITGEIGFDIPIHFTKFHPDYKLLNLPPTPIATLERARNLAISNGIKYAYVGNVPGHEGNSTYCPSCKKIVVKRDGMFTQEIHLKNNKCEFCNYKIAGVWK